MRYFRLVIIVLPVIVLAIILAPILWLAEFLRIKPLRILPMYWHRFTLLLIGVRVRVHGKFSPNQPLLLVCNHISWSDILVMGSVRKLCFIAKAEIGNWPGIKYFARMQRTVFVNRAKRGDTAAQADSIAARLLEGDAMVLFAEGTTGDGNKILPFNSSLIGAAQYAVKQSSVEKVMVQPVAIAYTGLHGMALGRQHQGHAAWPGDVDLAPHLINFLKRGAFDVDVVLGEPLEIDANSNRKAITKEAENQVRTMFGAVTRGKEISVAN